MDLTSANYIDAQMPSVREQLQKAGVVKSKADDLLSEQDKSRLLEYLRRAHGEADGKTKITLTRRETSEIRAQDSHGKSRTVQVEVRKKRVLVKRDPAELRAEAMEAKAALSSEPQAVPEVAAEPVAAVVDTTGAGDLFAAGFLAGYVRGESLERSLAMGSLAAGEIISHYGARPEVDLKALIEQRFR